MSAYRSQVADKAANIPKLEIRVKTCSCTGDLQPHRRPAAQQFQVASSHMTLPSLGLVRCAKVEQGRILCDGLGIISNCLESVCSSSTVSCEPISNKVLRPQQHM